MRHDDTKPGTPADTLEIPFLWVPAGQSPSPEWLAAHPDWVRLDASFVPNSTPMAEPPVQLAQLVMPGMVPPPPPLFPPKRGRGAGPDLYEDVIRIVRWLTAAPGWSEVESSREPASGNATEMAKPGNNDVQPLPSWAQLRPYRERALRAEADIVSKAGNGKLDAHHIISRSAATDFPDLMASAGRAGWEIDEVGNLMLLPADPETQEILRTAGVLLPLHVDGHPAWIQDVRQRLAKIQLSPEAFFGRDPSVARDLATLAALRALAQELRMKAIALGAGKIALEETGNAKSARRS